MYIWILEDSRIQIVFTLLKRIVNLFFKFLLATCLILPVLFDLFFSANFFCFSFRVFAFRNGMGMLLFNKMCFSSAPSP